MKHSYTAADQWPLKLALNAGIIRDIRHYIPPYHVQLYPTNRCSRDCSFCSCGKRDKRHQLNLTDIIWKIQYLKKFGAQAVTISGGGEPLLHPHINEIIMNLWRMGLDIGLVTNGDYLHVLDPRSLSSLTWIRISGSDEYEFDAKWWGDVAGPIVERRKNIAWSFSYVATKKFDVRNLDQYLWTAEHYNFTHVRVVGDLLHPDEVKAFIPDHKLLIWQPRKTPRRGAANCWVSLLRPVIGADGYIYPCCGVQYARKIPDRDNPEEMRMKAIPRPWVEQVPFDGSYCARCYYSDYNHFIENMRMPLEHRNFI